MNFEGVKFQWKLKETHLWGYQLLTQPNGTILVFIDNMIRGYHVFLNEVSCAVV